MPIVLSNILPCCLKVYSQDSEKKNSTRILKINNSANQPSTLTIKDFSLIDTRKFCIAQQHLHTRHLEIKPNVFSFSTYLKQCSQDLYDSACCFDFQYDKNRKILSFIFAKIDGSLPFSATDAFEVFFSQGLARAVIDEIKIVKMLEISSFENKKLANNLEKIRLKNGLTNNEKIKHMEIELFSGDHAGKFMLRCLNRVGLAPVSNSLSVDLSRPILSGSTVAFQVSKVPLSE